MSRTIRIVRVPIDNAPSIIEVDPLSEEFETLIEGMDLDHIRGTYVTHTSDIGWAGYIDASSKAGDVNAIATMAAGRLGWDDAGSKVLCGPVIFFGTSAEERDWEGSFPQPLLDLLHQEAVL